MSQLKTLNLKCDVQGYGIFLMRRQNPQFKRMAQAVLERDHYRCVYCGFQCKHFQEVINAEKSYLERRITLSDLETACPLCTACFFVGAREESPESGARLIYLSEMTQVELNDFARVLFCNIENDRSPYQNYAKSLYRSLRQRAQPFESIFGVDSSLPPVFASTLVDAGVNQHPNYDVLMKTVRVLPGRQHYRDCVSAWQEVVEPLMARQRGGRG